MEGYTKDVNLYCDEWNKLCDILCERYNCEIIGFDPLISIRPKEKYGLGCDLPMWLVKEMTK